MSNINMQVVSTTGAKGLVFIWMESISMFIWLEVRQYQGRCLVVWSNKQMSSNDEFISGERFKKHKKMAVQMTTDTVKNAKMTTESVVKFVFF